MFKHKEKEEKKEADKKKEAKEKEAKEKEVKEKEKKEKDKKRKTLVAPGSPSADPKLSPAPFLATMPPPEQLEADFAALLPELGIPPSKQQEMLTWDADRKWKLLLINLGKRAADQERHAAGRVTDTPQYFTNALRAEPTAELVKSLRVCLAGESVSWISTFTSLGGTAALLEIVRNVLRNTSPVKEDRVLLIECALAIKGLANNDVGYQSIFPTFLSLVVGMLSLLEDAEARTVVFQLMAAVSLENHAAVLSAMEEYRVAQRLRSRWVPALQVLNAPWDTASSEELRTAAMTLVNALVLHPEELAVRLGLREELIASGLKETLAAQRGRSQMLDQQIEAYEDVAVEDEYQRNEIFAGVDINSPADIAAKARGLLDASPASAEQLIAVLRQIYLACQAADRGEAVWPALLAVLRSEESRAAALNPLAPPKPTAAAVPPDSPATGALAAPTSQVGAAVNAIASKSSDASAGAGDDAKKAKGDVAALERKLEVAREESMAAKKDAANARTQAQSATSALAVAERERDAARQRAEQLEAHIAASNGGTPPPASLFSSEEREALRARVSELERSLSEASAKPSAPPPLPATAAPPLPGTPAPAVPAAASAAAPPLPPPLPGGGAPPPPPPPPGAGTGAPPPPPLPGGGAPPPMPGAAPAMAAKEPIAKPSVKLLQLQWKKVQAAKVKKSFWDAPPEPTLPEVKKALERIEKLYCARAAPLPMSPRSDDAAAAAGTLATRAGRSPSLSGGQRPAQAVVQLLETKRSNNLSILLSRIKASNSDIVKAILGIDESLLSPQFFAGMLKLVPTPEEIEMVKAYPEPATLGKAEQFFLELGDIEALDARLEAIVFKQQFQTRCEEALPGLRSIRAACEQLRKSKRFARLLGVVLTLGNFVNAGSARGGCYGFRLESLSLLADLRSAGDTRVTMLHTLVEILEEPTFADVVEWPTDLTAADEARRVALPQIAQDVASLRKGIEQIKAAIAAVAAAPAQQGDKFRAVMEQFLKTAEPQFSAVEDAAKRAEHEFSSLLEFYASEPSTTPEEFFSNIQSFRLMFEKVRKDMKFSREKAAKQQQQNAHRAAPVVRASAHATPESAAEEGTPGKMDTLLQSLRDTQSIRERRTSKIGHGENVAAELAAALARQGASH